MEKKQLNDLHPKKTRSQGFRSLTACFNNELNSVFALGKISIINEPDGRCFSPPESTTGSKTPIGVHDLYQKSHGPIAETSLETMPWIVTTRFTTKLRS